jgi:hypothetical protein
MRGRVRVAEGDILLGGLTAHIPRLAAASRIIIVGCGTSHNAGLIGEYLLESLARIPTEVPQWGSGGCDVSLFGLPFVRAFLFERRRTTRGSSESTSLSHSRASRRR